MQNISSVRPLRNEADHQEALKAIRPYFDNEPEEGTEAADHYDMLAMVIEKYEDQHHEIPEADPVDVLQLIMEDRGYGRSDLAQVLGSAPRASEILNRKRELSLDHIRRLKSAWRIPADALIGALTHA